MKCIKCKKENIDKANFCKYCGNEFSLTEKKKAKRKTIVGKLELIEKAYNTCSLKIITDNIIFKIVSLIFLIFIGLYLTMDNRIRIAKSDEYNIEYNVKSNEYYLYVSEDKINLNLYLPHKTKSVLIKNIDKDNKIISENNYDLEDEIILKVNTLDDYYLLKNENSKIKFFIYKVEN